MNKRDKTKQAGGLDFEQECKRLEEELNQERHFLDTLMNTLPDHIYIKERESRFIRNSKAHALSLGLSGPEEMVGKTDFDFFPKEFAEMAFNDEQEIIRTGQSISKEEQAVLSDQTIKWFSATKIPLRDLEGNIIGTFGISRDITKQKQAEIALLENESRLMAISDTAQDAILVMDYKGRISYWNTAAERMLGYTRAEAVGRKLHEFIVPERYRAAHYAAFPLFQKTGQGAAIGKTIDMEALCKDGKEITVQLSLSANCWNGTWNAVGVLRDITNRIKAEEEIKRSNEQLTLINIEKDKFFSIIAHDLRSPFNAFLGLTRMMVEDLPSMTLDEIQKIALMMSKSATNLYRLLENLLEWSQLKRGGILFNPVAFLLMPKMAEIMQTIVETAHKKGIAINMVIPEDLSVYADEYMLGSTLRNLVLNSVKFTPRGGNITVLAKPAADNTVEIVIRDSGIGMNEEMLNKLFSLDKQYNRRGTEDEPSTGLGLTLCKEFIEKHGGTIWAESEVDKGSVFHFTIPGIRQPITDN